MPIPEDTAELEQRITDLEAEIEKKSEECDSLHRLMAAFGAMYANLVSCGTEPPVINQGGCKDANVEE